MPPFITPAAGSNLDPGFCGVRPMVIHGRNSYEYTEMLHLHGVSEVGYCSLLSPSDGASPSITNRGSDTGQLVEKAKLTLGDSAADPKMATFGEPRNWEKERLCPLRYLVCWRLDGLEPLIAHK